MKQSADGCGHQTGPRDRHYGEQQQRVQMRINPAGRCVEDFDDFSSRQRRGSHDWFSEGGFLVFSLL